MNPDHYWQGGGDGHSGHRGGYEYDGPRYEYDGPRYDYDDYDRGQRYDRDPRYDGGGGGRYHDGGYQQRYDAGPPPRGGHHHNNNSGRYNEPPHSQHRQQNHYNDGYGHHDEREKVDVDPPPAPSPSRQSALDSCMSERNRRHQEERESATYPRKPGAFYDTDYDDMLERKRAEYAPPAPRTDNDKETMIELGPGVYARLRGASETWACIEGDFHVPVTCCACNLELCCIQDADYVLCPRCKVVSPLEAASDNFAVTHMDRNDGGVGLGFTFDELFKWQAEIMKRRSSRRAPAPVY